MLKCWLSRQKKGYSKEHSYLCNHFSLRTNLVNPQNCLPQPNQLTHQRLCLQFQIWTQEGTSTQEANPPNPITQATVSWQDSNPSGLVETVSQAPKLKIPDHHWVDGISPG